VARLDITKNVVAQDRLLETLENPRHRHIIENYRRHALLEVSGRHEEIFSPEMSIEEPFYVMNFGPIQGPLRGREVRDFYRDMVESGGNVMVMEEEVIAVSDAGLGQEGKISQFMPGAALAAMGMEVGDPAGWYQVRTRVVTFWPFDERARMIGEHGGSVGPPEVIGVSAGDVITQVEARDKLAPLIRDLPVFDAVDAR
jgi:hypothetical protein